MTRRSLFNRQFWREYRRDVLRAGRDVRARKGFLLRTLLLLYTVGVFCWYGSGIYGLHDAATYVLLAVLLGLVGVGIVARRIAHRLDERRSLKEDLAATPPGLAEGLRDLAYGALAISERALSELWLANHTVPEGFEPVGRRIQIQALQKTGTWTAMPTPAREWMMRPDKSWPLTTVADVLSRAEALHTLLWTLYLVDELRPLEGLLKPLSVKETAKALQRPLRGVRPTWDIRVARNNAHEYFMRVLAEGVHRGTVTMADEESRTGLDTWAGRFHDRDVPDLFAGDDTISEIDTEALDRVSRSSAHRVLVLEGALAVMEGKDGWERLTSLTYQPLLPQANTASCENCADL